MYVISTVDVYLYVYLYIYIWNPKQPFTNGCFNWMIPNLYIENGCFIKHPFINCCLGFQVDMCVLLPITQIFMFRRSRLPEGPCFPSPHLAWDPSGASVEAKAVGKVEMCQKKCGKKLSWWEMFTTTTTKRRTATLTL